MRLIQNFCQPRRQGTYKNISSILAKRSISQCYSVRHYVNLTLIGPPGAGKGTYGKLLMQDFNCSQNSQQKHNHSPFILSAGDVLRDHVINNTEIGQQVSECQRLGKLADDDLVSRALLDALNNRIQDEASPDNNDVHLGFILDPK